MINIKERVEGVIYQGIEDIILKARKELIRRNFFKLIFEKTNKELVNITYNEQ